jgi:homogentisate 1,2-dioxygenase
MLGNIPFEYGDYLIIPRIYQIQFDTEDNRLFYVESFALFTPKRYKKRVGTAFRAPPLRAIFFCPN